MSETPKASRRQINAIAAWLIERGHDPMLAGVWAHDAVSLSGYDMAGLSEPVVPAAANDRLGALTNPPLRHDIR